MKEKKLVGYTLIVLFLIPTTFILNKNKEFKLFLVNNDLNIEFPNEIFVKYYAIKDFEKMMKISLLVASTNLKDVPIDKSLLKTR